MNQSETSQPSKLTSSARILAVLCMLSCLLMSGCATYATAELLDKIETRKLHGISHIEELHVQSFEQDRIDLTFHIIAADKKNYKLMTSADHYSLSSHESVVEAITPEGSNLAAKANARPAATTEVSGQVAKATSKNSLPCALLYFHPGMGFVKEGTEVYLADETGQLASQKSPLSSEQLKFCTIVVLQLDKSRTVVRGWAHVAPKKGREVKLFPVLDTDFMAYSFMLGVPGHDLKGAKTMKLFLQCLLHPIAFALDVAGGVAL